MAWTKPEHYEGPSEGKVSKYNTGLFLTERLHHLQDHLNVCNSNLLIKNKVGVYGYQMVATILHSLMAEGFPKMGKEEQREILEFKKKVENILKLPCIRTVYRDNKPIQQIHKENWEKVKDTLFQYELKIRCLLDKHGLSSPDVEDINSVIADFD